MEVLYVILSTLVCFLALIMVIAAKPKFTAQITRIAFVTVGVIGLFFYGYGFLATTGNFGLSVVRALLTVCRMYMGDPDWEFISEAPLMQIDWVQVLFWIVHLLALFVTASAAITTLGAEALRKLRLRLARRGTLHLIYGANDDTIALAKQLQEKNDTVVFVDESAGVSETVAVTNAGYVLRSDADALHVDKQLLKGIGAVHSGRRINVYAMKPIASDNLTFAQTLLDSMKTGGIAPEQTRLVIRSRENAAAVGLQVMEDAYGYGSVTVIQETDLVARTLVRNYPPCNHLPFDENGKAKEDFEAVIIGFGQTGQTVLRHLVMNGQFEGSAFRAAVFSPDCNNVKGYFTKNYAQVLQQYDISFYACDARCEDIYDYLQERGSRIKYLVICTGSDRLNQEIAEDLTEYLNQRKVPMGAYLCSHRGVKYFDPATGTVKSHHSLYRPDMLSMEKMDALAMCVNSHYQQDPEKTPLEHWLRCDYFSRMSCRAVADFIPAMLKMANKSREQVLESGWDLTPAQLENLSKTEHLRWCAFHYAMGFAPMTREEYDARTETYRCQLAAGEKPLRIGKNMVDRTHACLISWEELVELSERENRITGKTVDYQAMDTENVLIVPELLRAGEKTSV